MPPINVGSINEQRVATFHKRRHLVVPAKYKNDPYWGFLGNERALMITPLEAFRRWKIARKAWRSRKERGQLLFRL